jgi:hypothetical protein
MQYKALLALSAAIIHPYHAPTMHVCVLPQSWGCCMIRGTAHVSAGGPCSIKPSIPRTGPLHLRKPSTIHARLSYSLVHQTLQIVDITTQSTPWTAYLPLRKSYKGMSRSQSCHRMLLLSIIQIDCRGARPKGNHQRPTPGCSKWRHTATD